MFAARHQKRWKTQNPQGIRAGAQMAQKAQPLNNPEISLAREIHDQELREFIPDSEYNEPSSPPSFRATGLREFCHEMGDIAGSIRHRSSTYISQMIAERSLHALGVLVGACFVTGMVLRIWRSNTYE
jgi:hypothetical protein